MQLRAFAETSLTRSLLMALPPTRFAGINRRMAAAIVVLTAFAMLALLAVASQYRPPLGAASGSDGDMAMYAHIVERMHAGVGYYTAAHEQLHGGGYGTQSVFNWRLPTLAWAESLFPSLAWANVLLGLGAIAALLTAAKLVRDTADNTTAVLAGLALAVSLFACATPAAALFTEIPAGILVLASACAYGLRRTAIGFVLALAALFIRELAAPYVLVCIYLAWRDERRTELWAWAGGLAAFSSFFAWHYMMVQGAITVGDFAYAQGWIQFGGLSFILAAARFNGMLLAAPLWPTAILLPICLLGLAAWRAPAAHRIGLTVAVYLVAFAIVGKPFNDYWGAMFTPLMMLGLAFVPAAVRDLIRTPSSARRP
jgi:hypothetical protein